jgi:DNA-binding CsgD family transcriptional regulator
LNQKDLSLLVYQTIENPQKRPDFLAAFAEIIDANAAAIRVEDRQLRWASLCVTHGMDQGTIDSYCTYYFGLNPFALRGVSAAAQVRTSEDVMSEAELRDTEFYHGWMQPRGWLHTAAVGLDATETQRALLVAYRPPNHPFTDKERAILTDLAPHLALATQIQKHQMALQTTINRLRGGPGQADAAQRFGLSPKEFTIASSIAHGQVLKEIAFKAGLTMGTLRWYVRNIHKKLGVNRQSDLVRVFLDNSKN